MVYPHTRPDGSPLETRVTPDMEHWFCRGGLDLKRIIPLGLLTDAQVVALWNARDMEEQKRCRTGGGAAPASNHSPG